jgi:hypothetical protein
MAFFTKTFSKSFLTPEVLSDTGHQCNNQPLVKYIGHLTLLPVK